MLAFFINKAIFMSKLFYNPTINLMEPIVDLYTPPLLKPYGQSFTLNPAGQNTGNRNRKNSIWYYNSPNIFEKGISCLRVYARLHKATVPPLCMAIPVLLLHRYTQLSVLFLTIYRGPES